MAHLLFLFWIPSLLIAASYAAILITLNSLSVVPEGIKRTAAGQSNPLHSQLSISISTICALLAFNGF
jgi:hypothetical protein